MRNILKKTLIERRERKLGDPWEDLEEGKEKRTDLDDKIDEALLAKRIIMLNGEITEETVGRICKRLIYLSTLDETPIRMILNSIGGEVYLGLLVYNTLEDLKKKKIEVTIEVRGVCASMGVVILQGASKRVASKYTRFLLHEVSSWAFGKASEVKEESVELDKVNKMLDEIVAERSKLTLKILQDKTKKRDWWLSATEALKNGLIDEII